MSEQGTHYRIGGKLEYCGVEILPDGRDIENIVIERIQYHDKLKVQGAVQDGVWTAHFAKNPYTMLPMILNSTNRKRIAKLFPNVKGKIDLLKNISVRLTQESTRDATDGGTTMGLRISKIPAKIDAKKPILTQEHEGWKACVDFIAKGGDIKMIKDKYEVSEEVEKLLTNKNQ